MTTTHFDVIGVGTAVVDYLGVVPVYPTADSQMELQSLTRQGGGNVSTTLATLAKLGASTAYVGKLGDDELGQFALTSLRDTGVDCSHVIVEPGASAGFAFIIVDAASGQRTILWSNQDKPRMSAAELILKRDLLLSGRFLHIDEYEMDAAIEAARIAHRSERKITIVLDAESGLSGIETLLPLADVITASHDFAVDFSGAADYQAAARALHRRMPASVVVVTAGERGCYCVADSAEFHQPSFAVEPVDTTGCGDVFRGAFTYGLLHRWELAQCAEFASATAALKCRALGGRAGIPTLDEVRAYLARR